VPCDPQWLRAHLAAANVAARRSVIERDELADVAETPIGSPERAAEVHAILLEAGAL
jgi:hypothetical protein